MVWSGAPATAHPTPGPRAAPAGTSAVIGASSRTEGRGRRRSPSASFTSPTPATSAAVDSKGRVLFVCTANVCRSPMAEAIFNALASDAGVPYEARSAGTAALAGEPMTPHAREVLEEVGVYPGEHRARQVDAAMLEEADLVLTMTPQQAASLRRVSAVDPGRINTLLNYAYAAPETEGISDPYGQPISAFRASVRRIIEGVDRAVSRLSRP